MAFWISYTFLYIAQTLSFPKYLELKNLSKRSILNIWIYIYYTFYLTSICQSKVTLKPTDNKQKVCSWYGLHCAQELIAACS